MEYSFFDFLKLIGSLALFLYGMKIMSEGLQKFAGDRLRSILTAMTTNRVTGMLTGILITALIQSSSATTVMVVSFVNAGLLTLAQSIGVIMGANVGTTVTAWIISVFGFKVDVASFALPMLAFGVPLLFSQKSSRKSIGEFIFGFAFLFMGLKYLTEYSPDLSKNPDMLAFVTEWTDMGFLSIIIFVFVGAIITMMVQASAATMAITLIMCANGWISFELGAALAMGQNIGTTITANIAALTGNTQARRAAMAHLLFNVFGVVVVLLIFKPFTGAVSWFVTEVMHQTDPATRVAFELSAFHTAFNVFNVLLLIWFVKAIERIVCFILPSKENDEEYRLRFISRGLLSTAELSILEARKEIHLYAERSQKMFKMVQDLLHTEKDDAFNNTFSRIEKYENICDSM
jgi:phosphate:Na+ symporter